MNYRHGFHAGNHADCLKHSALVNVLNYLKRKDKPVFVLDTHGGRGMYDLTSSEAIRAGEFRFGISRLMGEGVPETMRPFLDAVARMNGGGPLRLYPGSPLLIAEALRVQDRLVACERAPAEAASLGDVLGPYARARVEAKDGYGVLKASLPPPERRGLVLIDPPFEQEGEFDRLAEAMRQAWRRWPGGIYLVWYPVKERAAVAAFHRAIVEAGIADACFYELFVRAPASGVGMAGSGLLAVNASFALDAAMREILPFLADRLAQGPGADWRAERLTPE